MSQFSEAEDRFIDASIPVLQAGERQLAAQQEMEAASEAAAAAAKELGDAVKDVDYVHDLMLAAAERAGYAPDSEVVTNLNESYEEVKSYMQLVDQINEAANRAEARKILGFTDDTPVL